MKQVWDGLRLMSGHSSCSSRNLLPNTSTDYANELNQFYNRFDKFDFSDEIHRFCTTLESQMNSSDLSSLQVYF